MVQFSSASVIIILCVNKSQVVLMDILMRCNNHDILKFILFSFVNMKTSSVRCSHRCEDRL